MAESLSQFFLENFESHRGERAYGQRRGYRMEWFTYSQVLEMAAWLAKELRRRGIGKGERIMLWGENSAEWVAAFFGCTLRGVVVVPMDDGAGVDFARRVYRQAGAKLLVASRAHREEWIAGSAMDPVVVFDQVRSVEGPRSSTAQIATGRDDVLQIVFTSGTTADPKGVIITHGNVLANIAPLEHEMQRYLKYER